MSRKNLRLGAVLSTLLGLTLAAASQAQVTVVNMMPRTLSGETNQDSEPNLAINLADPQQIAGSAFTPDPGGGVNAPIYVSTDGGTTWVLNSIVPSNNGLTGDITLRFGGTSNTLYAGTLRGGAGITLNISRTANFTLPNLMTLLVTRGQVDQPYVQANSVPGGIDVGKDRVYVGDNSNLSVPNTLATATIDRSLDAAVAAPPAGFNPFLIESRNAALIPGQNFRQDGPPIRPAVHTDGTVYGIFYGWRNVVGNFNPTATITTDVVVVRDDNWAAGANPFTALIDPGDNRAGLRVVAGITVPWNNSSQPAFGQERFVGSNVSIAVDPRNSSRVYIAWADYPPATTTYTLHVRRSDNRGVTWTGDLFVVANATNPALAVNIDGKVGLLYQQVTGAGGAQRWETHLQRSANAGVNWVDLLLARPPATTPASTFIPYIGDYDHLMAVGEDFYGIFSANNTPDLANFPAGVTYQRNANFTTHVLLASNGTTMVPISIDPFFFHVVDGAPASYQRSANAASYVGFSLAPESLVSAFGTFSSSPVVTVKDSTGTSRTATVFFAGPGQINYQIPPGTALGTAVVAISSGGGSSLARGVSQIASVAPGLFSADSSGGGLAAGNVVRVHGDGSQVTEPVAQFNPGTGRYDPVPIDFGAPDDQLYLILYGTGIRGRSSLGAVSASVGFSSPALLYAGAQGTFVGEDQVNVGPLSRSLAGAGTVNVVLSVDNQKTNAVTVAFR